MQGIEGEVFVLMNVRKPHSALFAAILVLILAGCADLAPIDPSDIADPGDDDPSPSSAADPPDDPSDEPGIAEFEVRSLDGSGNNPDNPEWGAAGQPYLRISTPNFVEGDLTEQLPAPPRYISNRVFNDAHVNVFSERRLSQWVWLWGQFMDHSIGLRDVDGEDAPLPFDESDPLEEFTSELGNIPFTRSGTMNGENGALEQPNTVSSFLDAWNVYGGDPERLEWIREGPADGDLSTNSARMLTTDDGYLPTAAMRSDAPAPEMELEGRLTGAPENAVVAGDFRANENIALTGAQTLFVREHNRIVSELPEELDEELKFEIARRLVGAEQQFITYEEFLPAVGVELPEYEGYDPEVNPTVATEFATVGFRGHSMIHGDIEVEVEPGHYTEEQLAAFEEFGMGVEEVFPEAEDEAADEEGDEAAADEDEAAADEDEAADEEQDDSAVVEEEAETATAAVEEETEAAEDEGGEAVEGEPEAIEITVPLNLAFATPELVPAIGLGPLMAGMANNTQYRNDEMIDNQLRSVLFQEPIEGLDDFADCLDGDNLPDCFNAGVLDLSAFDMVRAFDHGLTSYNDLREAYSLERQTSFTDVTGEDSQEFPDDPEIDAENPLDDPTIMEFEDILDDEGNRVDRVRRSPLAARLNAIYGDVDALDPFVGMVSEAIVEGTDLGELERAIWTQQFQALRDGDRFFYENDPALDEIEQEYGLTFRRTLREIILDNTDVQAEDLPSDNVFFRAG